MEKPQRLLDRHPWLVFVAPFVVYMLVGSLEPTPEKPGGAADLGLAIDYACYPWVYTAKIVLTLAAVAFVLPGYRQFPARVTPLGILVGIVGVVVWVGACKLDLERRVLEPLGLGRLIDLGVRPGYNPLEQLADNPLAAWGFLAVRFFGLAVVVPVIEEFFLRGFLMPCFVARDWWKVPFGTVTVTAVIVGTVVPMLMHPGELVAAALWFSMVTWLMTRTRSIWNCVAAHAVTNFLLGVYVVVRSEWQLM
jgi:uncharacterized protein